MAYGSVNVPGVSGVSEDELNKVKAAAETAKEDAANALNAAGLAAKAADEAKSAANAASTAASEAVNRVEQAIEEGGGSIGGGGGGNAIKITFEAAFRGAAYTVTDGDETRTGTVPEGLVVSVNVSNCNSTYTIKARADNGVEYSTTVSTGAYYGQYTASISVFNATINVTSAPGAVVKATRGSEVFTSMANSSGAAAIKVNQTGTYTITATKDNAGSNSVSVNVTEESTYTATVKFIKLTVTSEAGASLTLTNGATTLTGGGTGTDVFYLPNTGTWTATLTGGGETSTKSIAVSAYQDYTLKVVFVSDVLNENGWDKIREVSDAGEGANYWKAGDTKRITLNGKVGNYTFSNLAIDAFILGFNHNASREGSNRIHFQIGKISGTAVALCDSQYNNETSSSGYFNWNYSSNTNSEGWDACYKRKTLYGNSNTPTNPLANSLMAALPADLRAVLKSVTKYTDNTGNNQNNASSVTTTTDYLFDLAEFEVFGTRYYANSAEQNYQVQYDYYKAGNSRVAYNHSSAGTAVRWGLRSPFYYSYNSFCSVNDDGSNAHNHAGRSLGLRPGFCYAGSDGVTGPKGYR